MTTSNISKQVVFGKTPSKLGNPVSGGRTLMLRRQWLGLLAAACAGSSLSACGGGGAGEGGNSQRPAGSDPPANPPSDAQEPAVPTAPSALQTTLLKFAETAARNWNFEGHTITDQFTASQGRWDYTDTTFEPWLFDRAQVWHLLHRLTGLNRWQQQAASDLQYYESRLSANGIFLNKTGEADTKYSYVHSWSTTADASAKNVAAYSATVQGWPNVANLNTGALWTERELWVALNAAVQIYAASTDAVLRTAAHARAQAMLDQWDAICAGRGAPLVTYTQHEGGGPGGTQPTDLVSSPWMSALYFQAARVYAQQRASVSANEGAMAWAQVRRQASDYFDWLNAAGTRGFYEGSQAHPEFTGLIFPAYLAGGTTIGDAGPSEAHMDHALDLAGFVAFTLRAKTALNLSTTLAQQRLDQMKACAERAFANWTRPTLYLPKYRLAPPRKFNWWARGLYELRINGGDG